MKKFIELPKLVPGDRVSIISPSAGLPGLFPAVYELGLKRLRNNFHLKPVEYPTTRQMNSALADRARDIMAAFTDPTTKAVIASIGGSDQIQLLPLLDIDVIQANPKPFFGYSDNTHLHLLLWELGIPSYYGGAIMTQFGMQGAMHELTAESLRRALFVAGDYTLEPAVEYTDEDLSWADETNLTKHRRMESNDGLLWDGADDVSGVLWGGCVESLFVQFTAGRYLPNSADLAGAVLFLETAEDIPEHWVIEYLLMGMGERGWLDKFKAVLIGRPKAWDFDKPNPREAKASYRKEQAETVARIVRHYNTTIPIVQNVDFGHTDPQIVLPMGSQVQVTSSSKKLTFSY